jgi:hypothetical protein
MTPEAVCESLFVINENISSFNNLSFSDVVQVEEKINEMRTIECSSYSYGENKADY